jgi:fluoroquinolone transport system permease protein
VSPEARRLRGALALALRVQSRARFPHVYLGVAVALAALLRLAAVEWRELLLPLLLLGEPGTLGLYLVAAHRYYERNSGMDVALRVTPLPRATVVAAPVLTTACLGTLAGLIIQALVLGVDVRLLWLAPPLFGLVVFSGLVGFALAERFAEFTRFLLGSVVPNLVLSLPFTTALGWVSPLWLVWLPSQWAMSVFVQMSRGEPDPALWAACCAGLAAANAAAMLVAMGAERSTAEAVSPA